MPSTKLDSTNSSTTSSSFRSIAERQAIGKSHRDAVSRSSHANWQPHPNRADPIDLLQQSNAGRLPELIPLRFSRMLASPFAFLRGAARIMAADLANTPATGIYVQACGDCHLANFGADGTPERNLIFVDLIGYAGLCGWALASAHARSGDPAVISGYLGQNDKFDLAIANFAVSYAKQTELDDEILTAAVKSGRIAIS